jgi:hypothetical protein
MDPQAVQGGAAMLALAAAVVVAILCVTFLVSLLIVAKDADSRDRPAIIREVGRALAQFLGRRGKTGS